MKMKRERDGGGNIIQSMRKNRYSTVRVQYSRLDGTCMSSKQARLWFSPTLVCFFYNLSLIEKTCFYFKFRNPFHSMI